MMLLLGNPSPVLILSMKKMSLLSLWKNLKPKLLETSFPNYDLNFLPRSANGDEVEDDIFCSVGCLELEVDDKNGCYRSSEFVGGENVNDQDGGLSSRLAGSQLAMLRTLFEQYGDISTLYTTCKHRGFVMISYYDIRAARNAMVALQNKPLGHRKLDIHFSIPKDNPSGRDLDQGTVVAFNLDSSVSSDDLQQIFAVYGEIKAIRATPDKQHKIIEFYDVRSAEAALCALNMSNVRGESIKLEVTKPGGARWSLMQQFPSDAEQKESGGCRMGSPSNSSPSMSNGLFPLENGAMQSLHSAIRGPFSPFMETDLHSCFV